MCLGWCKTRGGRLAQLACGEVAMFYEVWRSGLCGFMLFSQSLAHTQTYTLEDCNSSSSIHSLEGAVVKSQKGAYYTTEGSNCSVIFQTLGQQSTFLIHILSVDIRKDSINCTDHLSLIGLYNLTSAPSVILDKFCGDFWQLHTPAVVYTHSSYLMVKWITGAGSNGHHGFSVSLTTISQDPGVCASKGKFHCDNLTCISQSLVCDGTFNCLHGEDETNCNADQLATDSQVASPVALGFTFSSTTTMSSTTVKLSGSTTERPRANEVYLWLPLIVVVIFTGIMVTLIMVGRRGEDGPYDRTSDEFTGQNDGGEHLEMSLNGELVPSSPQVTTPRSNVYPTYTKADLFLVTLALLAMLVMFACCAWIGCCMNNTEDASERTASEVNLVEEHNRLQLEMNANAGYEHSEGMPETPPPTYDAIARQTSYVSHISQTSDQISIPPEYDEAVEWSNEHSRPRRSRLRHITRSRSTGRSASTNTPSSASRGLNFARLFSRSVSATANGPAVNRSGSETTQDTTTSTSDNNTTELSSVFVDTSPEIVIHTSPLPRPASHPLMSTPQTSHQGMPPGPSEGIGDDDVFDDGHQGDVQPSNDLQAASDPVHPSFFL
ncbi:hypothetical protein LSAT2_031083 [Lamellibrachia satsuma]|nr:hypothetical protein LSAT2_031083 [Lamellibrachia satsuma]